MLSTIRLKTNPTTGQKKILSQPMGCVQHIWDAKNLDESRKEPYCQKKEYPYINKTYSQYKVKNQTA